MKAIVIYHAGCPDGAMAAAVVYCALGDVDLVPASYQRPLSDYVSADQVAGRDVYVVDFSFPPEDVNTIARFAARVVVFDHHKSAVERFAGWVCPPNVVLGLDLNHSGAALAWRYFFPDPLPAIVAHVEDYDLWRHALPDSKAVHAYLRSLGMDVTAYTSLIKKTFLGSFVWESLLCEGRAILRANDQQAEVLASKPEVVRILDLVALAANAPVHQDDVGSLLAARCESGVGVAWYWRDGRYKVSLRSRPVGGSDPYDCSVLAKVYGGGGHRGAAAFTCADLPWKKSWQYCRWIAPGGAKCGAPATTDHPDGRCKEHLNGDGTG